jgi:hypothetical protein
MDDNMKNALWILYNAEVKCQVHSLYLQDDGYVRHDEKRCPRCIIEEVLKLSTG